MRLLIYMLFNSVYCFGNRPVAPLLFQALQAGKDSVCKQALLAFHSFDFLVLPVLLQVPSVYCKNSRKKITTKADNTLAVVMIVFWSMYISVLSPALCAGATERGRSPVLRFYLNYYVVSAILNIEKGQPPTKWLASG